MFYVEKSCSFPPSTERGPYSTLSGRSNAEKESRHLKIEV
jgi:hypothetical protein